MNKLSKIQASLMGVMIGDAMGMPVELMTPEDILAQTDGKGVTGFITPIQRKLKDTEKLSVGATTDDWQLTEAIGKSLVRAGKFDIYDIALAHVEAYEVSDFGWGTTTKLGLQQIKLFFDTRGREGRSPTVAPLAQQVVSKYSGGCGNGVAMKIAPLAIFENTNSVGALQSRVREVGKLTHPDSRASSAAAAIAYIIKENLSGSKLTRSQQLAEAIDWTIVEEFATEPSSDPFSKRLERLTDEALLLGPIEDLQKEVGTGCLALESVCFAVAVYLRHMDNFQAGILEAINSGGDTDSVAAMVGAMIGSRVGLKGIPKEWQQFNPDFQKAVTLGAELYRISQTNE